MSLSQPTPAIAGMQPPGGPQLPASGQTWGHRIEGLAKAVHQQWGNLQETTACS